MYGFDTHRAVRINNIARGIHFSKPYDDQCSAAFGRAASITRDISTARTERVSSCDFCVTFVLSTGVILSLFFREFRAESHRERLCVRYDRVKQHSKLRCERSNRISQPARAVNVKNEARILTPLIEFKQWLLSDGGKKEREEK